MPRAHRYFLPATPGTLPIAAIKKNCIVPTLERGNDGKNPYSIGRLPLCQPATTVARMQRSVIREIPLIINPPDFVALHPGYALNTSACQTT